VNCCPAIRPLVAAIEKLLMKGNVAFASDEIETAEKLATCFSSFS
jgi:hypothetical protein